HTSGGTSTPVQQVSPRTAKKIKKAGKSVSDFVAHYPAVRFLQSHASGPAKTPTAIGSAFDLGSGPTVLLIVLAGTAALLLGGSGMRVRRNRNHS
ncbi:MAG: hypothetical protein ACRDL7_02200, partial [Gaiellaceae bacterium]